MDNSKIVFHLDDLADSNWGAIDQIKMLKDKYPRFKATLFTIPFNIREMDRLKEVKRLEWIEMAIHGFKHLCNDEMLLLTKDEMREKFSKIDFSIFVRGFKAPGWRLNDSVVEVCNEFGLWVAMINKYAKFTRGCHHGWYMHGMRYGFHHGHCGNSEDNWIKKDVPMLLNKWPKDQEFLFVSEAIEG